MFFRYNGNNGTYTHAAGEVDVSSFTKTVRRNARGQPMSRINAMTIRGVLIASTQATIKSAVVALESSYGVDGTLAALYHDDGTRSAHFLTADGSLDGVRVDEISYPGGAGNGEYATGRTYEIKLSAEYTLAVDDILEYTDTVTFTGNGRESHVFVPLLVGPPQKQILNQNTTQKITQSGRAVGNLSYPTAPAPMFPDHILNDRSTQSWTTPGQFLNSSQKYPISWNYQMESPTPLSGQPQQP